MTCPAAIAGRFSARKHDVWGYLEPRASSAPAGRRTGRWIGRISRDDSGFWLQFWLLAV